MPKVTEEHKRARREQVLDAALSCFVRKGFHRASMNDIIEESGLSAGAIYLQFPSKREITIALAERILVSRVDALREVVAADELPTPAAVLRTLLEGLASEVSDTQLIVQFWAESAVDPDFAAIVVPQFARLRETAAPVLRKMAIEVHQLDADVAERWAESVVAVLMGMGQGYILQKALIPNFDSHAYFAGIERVLDPSQTV